jgi:hypothetical protein
MTNVQEVGRKMTAKKIGSVVFGGLLYGQAALGIAAVGAVLLKQPDVVLTQEMGYGYTAAVASVAEEHRN